MSKQPSHNLWSQNLHFATYKADITVTILPDIDNVFVHGPLWIKSKTLAKNLNIQLKRGQYLAFEIKDMFSDGASVPRPLWPLMHPFDHDLLAPAIAHDYLYRQKTIKLYVYDRIKGEMRPLGLRHINRKAADALFYEKMRDFGASYPKAITAYAAVRAFGKKAYINGRI